MEGQQMDKKPVINLMGVYEPQMIYDNPDTKVYMLKMPVMSACRIIYQVVGVFVGVRAFLKYIREKFHIEPLPNWEAFKRRLKERTTLEIDEYQGFGESLSFDQIDRCVGPMIDKFVEQYAAAMGALDKVFRHDII